MYTIFTNDSHIDQGKIQKKFQKVNKNIFLPIMASYEPFAISLALSQYKST